MTQVLHNVIYFLDIFYILYFCVVCSVFLSDDQTKLVWWRREEEEGGGGANIGEEIEESMWWC